MIPHPIRLRHPWESEPQPDGRILYRRRFNLPTGLEVHEKVDLEIDRAMVAADLSLNGKPLGRLKPADFFTADITELLAATNELCVTADPLTALSAPPPSKSIYITDPNELPGSPVGDVRLVIRAKNSD